MAAESSAVASSFRRESADRVVVTAGDRMVSTSDDVDIVAETGQRPSVQLAATPWCETVLDGCSAEIVAKENAVSVRREQPGRERRFEIIWPALADQHHQF